MARREDILRELGLAPRWRLRADLPAAAATPAPAVPVAPIPAVEPVEASAPGKGGRVANGDRRARIAALAWDDLAADIEACTACGLCRTRDRAVPGVGDPQAGWLFVGEAPGAEEDARGEPFVGQAGKLLDSMLGALGLARGRDVYIANVLKCRPPGNRAPTPQEAEACRPYLERQLALIRPRLIVALGKSAATLLLGTEASIASLRGRLHSCQGVPLLVTYHPAYLLRNLPDKAKAWEDLLLARRTIAAARAAAAPPG